MQKYSQLYKFAVWTAIRDGTFYGDKTKKIALLMINKEDIKTFCGFQLILLHMKLSTPQKRYDLWQQKNCKMQRFFYVSRENCNLQSVFYVYLFLGLDVTRCYNAQTVKHFAKETKYCWNGAKARSTVFLEFIKLRLEDSDWGWGSKIQTMRLSFTHRKQFFKDFTSRWPGFRHVNLNQ